MARRVPARRALLVAAGALFTLPAGAQSDKSGEFSVQRFDPAPGPRNFFSTRGVRTEGKMAWSAGFVANYANNPFVVVSCVNTADCNSKNAAPGRSQDVHVVKNLVTGDFLGSLTPIDRLQIGLKVPVSYSQGDGLTDAPGTPTNGLPVQPHGASGAGLGDPEVEAKFRAYGEVKDTVVAGAGVFLTAPLGHATSKGNYIGDGTPIVGLRGIFDGKQGPYSFGANLAGLYRGQGRVGSTTIGSEFRYGVGAGFQASQLVRVILDGFGATKFSSKNGTNSLEIDGGVVITPLSSPIGVLVGGGAGVIEGVGVPAFRAIVGVTDGCPDRDNDGDTIQDKDDKCPNQAEDFDGFQDTDGCPDPDNDNDGVDDAHDQCPDKAETKNGFKDDDGCPDEPDRDGDGVPDAKDQCPDQPEDTDGFQDTDGCPDPDNDGDGIKDEDDECVDEPETVNGFQDEDGCPDEVGKAGTPAAKKKPGPAKADAPKPDAPKPDAPKPDAPKPAP